MKTRKQHVKPTPVPKPIQLSSADRRAVLDAKAAESAAAREAEIVLNESKLKVLKAQHARVELFERLARQYHFDPTASYRVDDQTGILTPASGNS